MTKPNDTAQTGGNSRLHPVFENICAAIFRTPALDYSDFIAITMAEHMPPIWRQHIEHVGKVQWDLHPTGGYMLSCKKTLELTGINGRRYRIIIEAVDE